MSAERKVVLETRTHRKGEGESCEPKGEAHAAFTVHKPGRVLPPGYRSSLL